MICITKKIHYLTLKPRSRGVKVTQNVDQYPRLHVNAPAKFDVATSHGSGEDAFTRLEDLTVLKRSPDLLNNVKIGQDQLRLIIKHILFYRGCGHFGQVT